MAYIELVKPNFAVGNEKRFFDFVSGLNDKEKIALISHTDLDGICSAKIANEVINADIVKFVDYEDLNESLVQELKDKKIKKVIFTDLFLKNKEFLDNLSKFSQLLIIDHHSFSEDFNSDKITFLNSNGKGIFCASYLCYYLFSKLQNIEKWDWLVASASISDWTYFENKEWMKEIFSKYGDDFIIENGVIRKSGIFWDLQWNLSLAIIYYKENLEHVFHSIQNDFGNTGDLLEKSAEVQKEIDSALENFEKEKEEIKGRIFWKFNPKFRIGSIISTLISSKNFKKTVIILRENEGICNFSARRQDKMEDMNLLSKNLVYGFENSNAGGHIPASGGYFPVKYFDEFKKRLKNL